MPTCPVGIVSIYRAIKPSERAININIGEKVAFKGLRKFLWLPLLLCAVALDLHALPTPAGIRISNIAVGTYQIDGQSYRVESNRVEVEVRTICGLTIEESAPQANPLSFVASAGTQAILPFVLTNTGNSPDSFILQISLDPGSDLQYGAIAIYGDENGNGLLDAGEAVLTDTGILASGESIHLLVVLDIRSFATAGQHILFDLTGTSAGDSSKMDDDNWRSVVVTSDAALNVSKSSSVVSITPGGAFSYAITMRNTGNRDTVARTFSDIDIDGTPGTFEAASGIMVTDEIPEGVLITGQSTIDFPPPRQVGAVPLYGYANGAWSSEGNIAAWGGTSAVKSVGWLLEQNLSRGQSASFVWRAVAASTLAVDIILNKAEVLWSDASGIRSSITNIVGVGVKAAPGVEIGPKDDPAGTGAGSYGSPSLTDGPYAITYASNISTAAYVSGSASNATRVVFWNTVKNAGATPDSFNLWHEWSANPIQGAGVRFYAADGATPLHQRAIVAATVGPLAPGESLTFMTEVTVPLGIPVDALEHDLRIGASSKLDSTISARTTDRIRFSSATWAPFLKTASPTLDIVPGAAIRYTISFGNAGSEDAVDASLFDILDTILQSPTDITDISVAGQIGGVPATIPVSAEFSAGDPTGSRGRLVWIFPNIPAGYVGSVSYQAVVDPAAADGTIIENRASITARGMTTAVSNTTRNMAMRPNRLIVEKIADRAAAGRGTIVRYNVKVKNASTTTIIGAPLAVYDTLPKGFNYISGSAQLNGVPIADPVHITGTRTIAWADVGQLAPSAQKTLSYAVLIGPTAQSGENFNTAYAHGTLASGTGTDSNNAAARVVIYESLAVDSQTIIGRVFFDLNGDKVPDEGEPGLSGVRIYLENGTYTVTDSQGKYHFEDIKAGLHVVKMDKGSLPRGIELLGPTRVGNLEDSDSILVDVMKGELFKANFRVAQKMLDSDEIALAEVAKGLPSETVKLDKHACVGLSYTIAPAENRLDEKIVSVSIDKSVAGPLASSYLVIKPLQGNRPPNGISLLDSIDMQSIYIDGKLPGAVFPFEEALWIKLPDPSKRFDAAGFDKNIPKTNVEEFEQGNAFTVRYIANQGIGLSHYLLGIDMQNAIAVIRENMPEGSLAHPAPAKYAEDPVKGLVGIYRLIQPEASAASFPDQSPDMENLAYGIMSPADGETYWTRDKITAIVRFPTSAVAKLAINGKPMPEDMIGRQVLDARNKVTQYDYVGVPLSEGKNVLELSYSTSDGSIILQNVKVFLAGKVASVVTELRPKLLFADGKTEPEIVIKPLDAAGIPMPEGSFVTLSLDQGRFVSKDANLQREGFQAKIEGGSAKVRISAEFSPATRHLEVIAGNFSQSVRLDFLPYLRDWIIAGYGQGTARYGISKANQYGDVEGYPDGLSVDGQLALFAKGTIFGCYLLTAAYDSRPPEAESKLFQELQPDKVFPIYGDASVQKYDAQTSDGKFVKIEKDKSYVLYGDYNTEFSQTELTKYNRSFTGAKAVVDACGFGVEGFWTKTRQSLVKDEIRGDGTSGYYYLSRASIVENSDKLTIEVRSVNDPAIVLKSTALTRYTDYWINTTNGSVLFSDPVQSADAAGNSVFIVAVYEVEDASETYDVFGIRPKLKLFDDALEIGGTGVLEKMAAHDNFLYGADAVLRLGKHITAKAEAAWSDIFDSEAAAVLNGMAQTISFKIDYGNDFLAVARYYNADADFRNPNVSSFEGAVSEYSLRVQSAPDEATGVFLDATSKQNFKSGASLLSAGLQGRMKLADSLRSILGLRYVDLDETAFGQKAVLGKAGMSVDLTSRLTSTLFFERALWGDRLSATDYSSASTLFDRLTSTSASASPLSSGYMETGADTTFAGYPDRVFLGLEYGITESMKVGLGHEWLGGGGDLVGRTVFGISSSLFRNTYAYANYGLEDAIDVPRNLASFGIKSKFDIAKDVSLSFGLESLYVIEGVDNGATFVAPAVDLTYLGDLDKRSLRLQYRYGMNDQRFLIEAAASKKVSASLAYSVKDIFSLTLYNSGGNDYRHSLSVGLSYRPLRDDRFNFLSKLIFSDTRTLAQIRALKLVGSLEANFQPTPNLTFSGKYTAKYLFDSTDSASTGSFLDLYAIRALYDVSKNVDFGFHFGFMPNWAGKTLDYYAGVETGYRLVKNLYASAGWNYKGLTDADLVENSYHSIGFFLSLRIKFDEGSFGLDK